MEKRVSKLESDISSLRERMAVAVLKTIRLGFYALILLVVIIGAMDGESTSDGDVTTGTEKQETSKSITEDKKDKIVGIGNVLRIGDVEFTINSFETVNQIGSGYAKETPDAAGAVFLRLSQLILG